MLTFSQLFFRSPQLKNHIKNIHEGVKASKCKLCEKSFNGSTALRYHVRSFHEGVKKEHKCQVCGNGYATSIYLREHIKKVHNLLPTTSLVIPQLI